MHAIKVQNWSRDVELDKAHVAQLRLVQPQDAAPLRRAFAQLPTDDVHEALYEIMRELPPAVAARLASNDVPRAITIVATEPGKETIVGFARLAPIEHSKGEAGDLLVLVAHPWRGTGLERALLRELVIEAEGVGYRRIQSTMLAEDGYHADLYRQLGWTIGIDRDDPLLRLATFEFGE